MKPVAYLLAVILGLLGVIFVAGSQGSALKVVVGIVFFAAAAVLVWLARMQPSQTTHTVIQKIDLSGDVNLQNLTCKSCGGNLSEKSISVKAGAVFVHCEYCGAEYQLEEEPKW